MSYSNAQQFAATEHANTGAVDSDLPGENDSGAVMVEVEDKRKRLAGSDGGAKSVPPCSIKCISFTPA